MTTRRRLTRSRGVGVSGAGLIAAALLALAAVFAGIALTTPPPPRVEPEKAFVQAHRSAWEPSSASR